MANLNVSGGISINLLVNGDNLNTTLNATAPLYQTFKKGTVDFTPNWGTMSDSLRPIVYPRIYSVMEAKELKATNVSWKYNGVGMTFGGDGVATLPDIAAGNIKQIDYNGSKALKMIGNVASESNNDSDIITFTGSVSSSGQTVSVSAEIPVLVEEASGNLYRLFLTMADDVIDGDETSLTMKATLFSSGTVVDTDCTFEFLDINGTVLRANNASDTFVITRDKIDSELLVVCKAYFRTKEVAREQRQVWDATDPYTIICDRGTNIKQRAIDDYTYGFSLLNARTGSVVPGAIFQIKVYSNATLADITSQFTPTQTKVTISGAKIQEHKSIFIEAHSTINL